MKESSNFDKNASDGIPEPVSQGEYRTQTEADRRMEEISTSIKRICKETIRDAQASDRDLSRQEEIEAERFAKENGLRIPFRNVDNFGEPYPGGNENIVFYNQRESAVYKVNNLINAGSITKLITHKYFFTIKYFLIHPMNLWAFLVLMDAAFIRYLSSLTLIFQALPPQKRFRTTCIL